MFSTGDTIAAIATPPGRGGIGVVRISGPSASRIARRLTTHAGAFEPRRATFTWIRASARAEGGAAHNATPIDQAVVTFFPAPRSYTGEDVVELSVHGSPVVLRAVVAEAIDLGARLAEPGEFTLRAFLNGRVDLPQAEAIADLIDAVTPLQARAAFDQLQGTLTREIAELDASLFDLVARLEASIDFPDEGYHFVESGAVASALEGLAGRTAALLAQGRRGRIVREGLQVAIVGRPNVGKSSLFNALVGAPRAIVTDTPGTTRDLVTETIDLLGVRVTLVDTAGLRLASDEVEAEGVERARQAQRVADLSLLVVDGSVPPRDRDEPQHVDTKSLVVVNKIDLAGGTVAHRQAEASYPVSAKTGAGLDHLRTAIVRALDVEPPTECPAITNLRHITLVERAYQSIERARRAVAENDDGLPEEFVLADLQQARSAFEEIVGRRTPDDVLAHIFGRFCIGK
jgi:tRNA modification GTPase